MEKRLQLAASLLVLLALALLVIGLGGGRDVLWRLGLAAAALAMGLAFLTRFVRRGRP